MRGMGERSVMPYIDATGARLYFEENGHGYPIIFLHEFGSDNRQLDRPSTVVPPTA
jgi:hypothetical protein